MKPDQKRVSDIVMSTVIELCESGLEGSSVRVQGVIGVTVDDSDVFLIHINDAVRNLSATAHRMVAQNNLQEMSPLSMSSPAISMSSPGCSSARKRARHRLVFQSPDTFKQKRHESEDVVPISVDGLRFSVDATSSKMEQSKPANQTDSNLNACNYVNEAYNVKQPTSDMKPNCDKPQAAKTSVVIVDSDNEDDDNKIVIDADKSKLAVCQEAATDKEGCTEMEGVANTAHDSADAVSQLCIADVVGSVSGWYDTTQPSPAVIKDDRNSYHNANGNADDDDGDDVKVMEEEDCNMAQATPSRQFKRRSSLSVSQQWSPYHRQSVQMSPATQNQMTSMTLTRDHRGMPTYNGGTPPTRVRPPDRPPTVPPNMRDERLTTTPRGPSASGTVPHGSPVSYRTMYVCNINQCSRGFAYKKNLITHQRSKHSLSGSHFV